MFLTPLVALLFATAPLWAQDSVRGYAVDAASGLPLRCVDVTVQDTSGHAVAHALTASDGSFRLDAPAGGTHRLEFAVWHFSPLTTMMRADSVPGRPPVYPLMFEPAPLQPPVLWPDTADSPPGRPLKFIPLHYPTQLLRKGLGGMTLVRYAVDSTGKVDRSSIEVLDSSDRTVVKSVVDFLREIQFQPARRAARPVCSLEFAKSFTLNAHP
jgi:TonB family protein